jgi:hypothetical protein
MSRIDELIVRAEDIINAPEQIRFEPVLLLELLVEIAKSVAPAETGTYETPKEIEINDRARRAGRKTQAVAEPDEGLS